MAVETWVLLATVALLAWLYSKWRHSYWSSMGVSSPPSTPFLGHFNKDYFIGSQAHVFYQENYVKFSDAKMFGLYALFRPLLVIWEPEMLKQVFVKDFDHFNDLRDFSMRTGQRRDEVFSEMLSLKHGEEWKRLRGVMTPTFTSGKIKSMFPLVCDKADALLSCMMKQAAENPNINVKNMFGRFTMDTIGSCAFGIECNSLGNKNDDFLLKVETFFTTTTMTVVKIIAFQIMPRLFKLFGIGVNPIETEDLLYILEDAVAAREAGEKRGDFLDLLLEAREQPGGKEILNDLSLIAQCLIFLVAGYETTASLLTFTSFLLAKHQEQQQRLRDEVREMVAEHGGITYQGIMEAKLLDACLQECLRLYPPAIATERCCTKAYKLPGTDVILKPGDVVEVPIWSIQHDPNYWPDPEAFIPDRFLPEKKADIIPCTHIPFGMGPRNCIGMRFAMMEAKIALTKLLLEAKLDIAPGYEDLNIETNSSLLRPKGGVLNVMIKPVMEE